MWQSCWWIILVLLLVVNCMCVKNGIQPNPAYRFIARRTLAGGTRPLSKTAMGMISFGCLIAGLAAGLLVYYITLRCLAR